MNDHHQQQMMNMNMNQNQQQLMSMNQHQPQPQQQVIKPPKTQKNYSNINQNYQDSMSMGAGAHNSSSNYLKRPHQPSNSNQQMMMMMNNRGYGSWGPQLGARNDQLKFQNPGFVYVSGNQKRQGLGPRGNWKGKKGNDKRKEGRRNETVSMAVMAGPGSGSGGVGGGYKPPMLQDLQYQNRVKAQRFFTKKKFNNNNNSHHPRNNMGKFAPRNTSSFLIRAKKSGGIAELVSPCPVTPAVLPTPMFSPSREDLVDMAKEEWGVDGYGSMKGLIRLRSPGRDDEGHDGDEEDEEGGGGSSESDVEEHAEVERRLDHDLSRFEMIYPNYTGGIEYNNVLENRVDDQDSHIAQLEEENMILKERLFFMEREFGELRRRIQFLERQGHGGGDEINEEVVENGSENDSESHGEAHSMEYNNEEYVGENTEVYEDVKVKEENDDVDSDVQSAKNDGQNVADVDGKDDKDDWASEVKDVNMVEDVEVKEPINCGKAGKEEENEETDTFGLGSGDVAGVTSDEFAQADDDKIGKNPSKDEAAGNE